MSPAEDQAGGMVALGRVSGAHGVRGWVRVRSDTAPPEAILDYQPWLLGPARRPLKPVQGQKQGNHVLALLEGISDRDQARSLAGLEIAVPREQLPAPGEGCYYWADLIGLGVFLPGGEKLGTIERMMATGANDVMVVRGDKERLIPFSLGRHVLAVDLEGRRVTVDWDPEF